MILNKITIIKFIEKVKKYYENYNEILAYFLFFLVVLLQFIETKVIQKGVVLTLLFIIITILFNINSEVAKKHTAKLEFFNHWRDVVSSLDSSLEEVASNEEHLNIRVLAVSLRYAWDDIIEHFIRKCMEENHHYKQLSSVLIEIAIIEPDWLEERSKYNFDYYFCQIYKKPCLATITVINAFIEEHKEQLEKKKINIELYKYKHMPNLYGILINNRIFYRGICHWFKAGNSYNLEASGGEYELYSQGDTFKGSEKIMEFNSWFDYCKNYEQKSSYLVDEYKRNTMREN